MPQIPVSPTELTHISQRIETDYNSAQAEHDTRMRRWNVAYRALMQLLDQVSPENRKKNNLQVPLMLWHLLDHISGEHQAIFGQDAHIEAEPTGDADAQTAAVVGSGMHWLLYKAIGLKRKWGRFSFYRAFFGRAFAHRPYEKKTYKAGVIDPITGEMSGVKDITYYHAPGFNPCWPDDIVVPAEDVESEQDFSFLIHRQFLTLEELLDGERKGKYFGITENIERIAAASRVRYNRTSGGQDMKQSRDQAEGVEVNSANERNGRIEVWGWYSTWHFPLPGENGELADAQPGDRNARQPDPTEVECSYINEIGLTIGVEDLVQKYPEMRNRRPFWSSALNDALSYWGPGYAHMLFGLQMEATENHKIFAESGRRNAIATVFMKPIASTQQDKSIEIEPGRIYYTHDARNVQSVKLGGDTSWCTENDQKIAAMAERLTGRSDLNSGRMIDRPNAPKTATQTVALLEAGNVRLAYNADNINEDLALLLADYWRMWAFFGGEQLIFRVTEKDLPPAIFSKIAGMNEIEQAARSMSFDFKLRFAPTEFRRAAQRQDAVALLQLDLTNPVVMQSPRALWNITRRVHELHGDREFASLVPQPADLDIPKNPLEEWVRMQQGEEVLVNPNDPDEVHIADHMKRLLQEAQLPDPDPNLIAKGKEHLDRHYKQLAMKRLMQAAMGSAMEQAQQQMGMGGEMGGQPQQPMQPQLMGGGGMQQ